MGILEDMLYMQNQQMRMAPGGIQGPLGQAPQQAAPQPQMPAQQPGRVPGLLEQSAALNSMLAMHDPSAAVRNYQGALLHNDRTRQLASSGGLPSNIQEWQYYNSLSEEDQKRYLDMKRGPSVTDLAGGKAIVRGGQFDPEYLSTLDEEARAKAIVKASQESGKLLAKRHSTLRDGRTTRIENFRLGSEILTELKKNDLPTGLYTGLVYEVIPTEMQEKLNSLAETVARQRLKLEGDERPTDQDVAGMKRALFGQYRTEAFNRDSLERLLRELESQEMEFQQLGNALRDFNVPGVPAPQTPSYMRDKNLTDEELDEKYRRKKNSGY